MVTLFGEMILVEIWVWLTKQIKTKKHIFNFHTTVIIMAGSQKSIRVKSSSTKFKLPVGTLMKESKPMVVEICAWSTVKLTEKALFQLLGYQDFDAKNEDETFLIKYFTMSEKHPNEN